MKHATLKCKAHCAGAWWSQVGPDAYDDDPNRGPKGYDEFNQAKTAGNYGWPYCIANNRAYVKYDFASGTSSYTYSCDQNASRYHGWPGQSFAP